MKRRDFCRMSLLTGAAVAVRRVGLSRFRGLLTGWIDRFARRKALRSETTIEVPPFGTFARA